MKDQHELQKLRSTSSLALMAAIAAVIFSLLTFTSQRQLRDAEDNRYQAYRLTEQLRLSSDNLTMMARAYASTGEKRFKDNFYRIVAIRDGLEPRPVNYHRVYWDLQMVGFHSSELGDARPLDELMVEAGIVEEELELLRRAKTESDILIQLEHQAFQAVEGRFPDANGEFTIEGSPNRELALQLLYSPEYFLAKARIMGYINRFYEKMETRTAQQVEQLVGTNQTYTALALFAFTLLIGLLITHGNIRRRLQESWMSQMQAEIDAKTADLQERNKAYEKTIVELKETQKQLLESEKFSTLGNLVSSVTHEINTPLSVGITASTHAADTVRKLCEEYEKNTLSTKQFHHYLDSIQSGMSMVYSNLERVSKLMGSFKQISVDQSLDETRRINLADYVHNILLTLLPKYRRSTIQLVEDIPDDLDLYTEPGALAQVITNIVVNAYTHAFDDGEEGRIVIHAEKQNDNIVLMISDNGSGMSREIRERLYQPFFTTKRASGGTGLGMNIVYKLVTERLKGHIHCETAPGQGSRFYITLPEQLAVQASDKIVPFR